MKYTLKIYANPHDTNQKFLVENVTLEHPTKDHIDLVDDVRWAKKEMFKDVPFWRPTQMNDVVEILTSKKEWKQTDVCIGVDWGSI